MKHTRTRHMTRAEIRQLKAWLSSNTQKEWYVSVRKTKMARTTGKHSVVIYLDDDQLWPQFILTWG